MRARTVRDVKLGKRGPVSSCAIWGRSNGREGGSSLTQEPSSFTPEVGMASERSPKKSNAQSIGHLRVWSWSKGVDPE